MRKICASLCIDAWECTRTVGIASCCKTFCADKYHKELILQLGRVVSACTGNDLLTEVGVPIEPRRPSATPRKKSWAFLSFLCKNLGCTHPLSSSHTGQEACWILVSTTLLVFGDLHHMVVAIANLHQMIHICSIGQ